MANTKEYKIVINGITESVKAVISLNKQLESLEARINELNSKAIKISASSTGGGYSTGGGGSKSSSSKDISVQNEINKLKQEEARLNAKIAASENEIFKIVDATKAKYKERIADQKAVAAEERHIADAYSHTMMGMKQKLADVKQIIQTTVIDEPDGQDRITKLTQEANELTDKLKKMEEAYGQFGRNVGNYKSAFDGLDKVRITIGDTTREFGSAREALKTLNNELKTMAVNGQDDTMAFKELQQKVMELESAANDAKKPMDNLMDSMQSVMAIANLGQGIRGLFGVDDAEMQKSIKNLVALQNVLKGIETINKQMKTGEGIGAWIAPFNKGIDTATKKALVFNRALLGTGKAANVASVAIKGFSKALKVAFSAGILVVIDLVIEGLMNLVESFKKVDEAADEAKEAQKDIAKAYAESTAKIKTYQAKVKNFNGTQEQEKRLVKELNSEFGNTLGTYDSLAQWMDILTKKGEAYIKMLVLQAKAQASFNKLVKDMEAKQEFDEKSIEDFEKWYDAFLEPFNFSNETLARQREKEERKRLNALLKVDEKIMLENQKELEDYKKKHGIGEYAPQVSTNNTTKAKQAVKKEQTDLTDLELKLMKEGLYKRLRQLDEDERQTLAKLAENAKKNEAEIKRAMKIYNQLRQQEIDEYVKTLAKASKESQFSIEEIKLDINAKEIESQVKKINDVIRDLTEHNAPINNEMLTGDEIAKMYFGVTPEALKEAREFVIALQKKESDELQGEYYAYLEKKYSEMSPKYQKAFTNAFGGVDYKAVRNSLIEDLYKEMQLVKQFDNINEESLRGSFENRLSSLQDYERNVLSIIEDSLYEEEEKLKEAAKNEEKIQKNNLKKRFDDTDASLKEQINKTKEAMQAIEKITVDSGKKMTDEQLESYNKLKETHKSFTQQQIDNENLYKKQREQIEQKTQDKINDIVYESGQKRIKLTQEQNERYLKAYDDLLSKTTDILNSQPEKYKTMNLGYMFDIPNIKQSIKKIEEVKDAFKLALDDIQERKNELERQWQKGLIKPEVYSETLNKLNQTEEQLKQGLADTEGAVQKSIDAFVQGLNNVIQIVGQSISQVMDSIWDYQSYMIDKELDELDKWNEELDKKLDEQKEIVEKHKDAIDSIEDELSEARGERRQHLIDQLNSEMEAQRAALAEEKKIEKEKKAAEDKQEQLEKKRRKQEYDMKVKQAFINWHLSIASGLATEPFMPLGIAMGALATVLGAAQYALVKSQKPYAEGGRLDGGVAQGPRHSQGGIPVLGGKASIEGGEFITNRLTTSKNIELLDYINSKKKRVDINDLIDFYSSGKVKSNIKAISPQTKFATGGIIPTITANVDTDDRILRAIEAYNERNVVVSVQDINSRQEAVKNVQVLAGLE